MGTHARAHARGLPPVVIVFSRSHSFSSPPLLPPLISLLLRILALMTHALPLASRSSASRHSLTLISSRRPRIASMRLLSLLSTDPLNLHRFSHSALSLSFFPAPRTLTLHSSCSGVLHLFASEFIDSPRFALRAVSGRAWVLWPWSSIQP